MIKTNAAIVFDGVAIIQSINLLYHFDFIIVVVSGDVFVFIKYPGSHNAEKPKGILKIIFHVGILNSDMRLIFTYRLISINPSVYSRYIDNNTVATRMVTGLICMLPARVA